MYQRLVLGTPQRKIPKMAPPMGVEELEAAALKLNEKEKRR